MKRILAFSSSTDATVSVVMKYSKNAEIIRFNSDRIEPGKIFSDYLGNTSLEEYDAIWYRRPFEFEKKSKNIDDYIRKKEWKEMV